MRKIIFKIIIYLIVCIGFLFLAVISTLKSVTFLIPHIFLLTSFVYCLSLIKQRKKYIEIRKNKFKD